MSFDDAKLNFFRAARHGLDAPFQWIDGQSYRATSLIADHLLPLAIQGLRGAEVSAGEIDNYLGVIKERVHKKQTGARWMTKSLADRPNAMAKDVRPRSHTAAMLACQKQGVPV